MDPQLWSGEPNTSLFGTLFNIFITWLASEESDRFFDIGGMVEEVVASGDDKVDTVPFERTKEVCENLGLEVTLEGSGSILDVPFLGRYHFLLNGRLHSCAQFTRTLSKFHYSVNGSGDRMELLRSKCSCYLCTDYHTPVIGAIAYYVVSTYGGHCGDWTEHQKSLTDLGVNEFLAKGPPVFCDEAAAVICLHEEYNVALLRWLHHEALKGRLPYELPVAVPDWFTDYTFI